MTVEELRNLLAGLDDDLEVVVYNSCSDETSKVQGVTYNYDTETEVTVNI